MPNPKDGTPGSLVPPAAPTLAQDADEADPGQVEQLKDQQLQTQTGKYGTQPIKPYKKAAPEPNKKLTAEEAAEQKKSWIEISLHDEQNKPVPGAKYRITLPDDSIAEGTLDDKGTARVEAIDPGNCQITFPDLHPDIWSHA